MAYSKARRLANLASTSHGIADDQVTTASIADDAITSALIADDAITCLLYTSPSPRDLSTSRMPSSA